MLVKTGTDQKQYSWDETPLEKYYIAYMPKCKNNPSRSYNGTEPSPKGLGYCAYIEKVESN